MTWIFSGFADEASQSVDEQVRTLQLCGMNHIDLRNVDGINIVDLPPDHAEQVRRKLDAAGIQVCMYGAPIGKLNLADDLSLDLKRLEHLGRLKPILGAHRVRIFSYYNRVGQSEDLWRRQALDQLRRLAEAAGRLGLVLYHENEINVYGDLLKRVAVLRDELHRACPDQFKLIFDFDNFNQCGEDVWNCWQTLRDDVEAIHIKESRRQPDGSFQHVPAGQGDGRIADILKDLVTRRWSGPLTLEPHLARSAAVLATGPHGQANAQLASLTPVECFQVAAEAAKGLFGQLGAPVA